MRKIQNVGVQFGALTLPTEQGACEAMVREAVYENRRLDDLPVTVSGLVEMTPTLGPSFPLDTRLWHVDVLCIEDHGNGHQCHSIDAVYWRAGVMVALRWEQTYHQPNLEHLLHLLTMPPVTETEKGDTSWLY